jgi:hypothetical protein
MRDRNRVTISKLGAARDVRKAPTQSRIAVEPSLSVPELELRMRETFGAAYEAYSTRTRRWSCPWDPVTRSAFGDTMHAPRRTT